jgi:hypothetical protein
MTRRTDFRPYRRFPNALPPHPEAYIVSRRPAPRGFVLLDRMLQGHARVSPSLTPSRRRCCSFFQRRTPATRSCRRWARTSRQSRSICSICKSAFFSRKGSCRVVVCAARGDNAEFTPRSTPDPAGARGAVQCQWLQRLCDLGAQRTMLVPCQLHPLPPLLLPSRRALSASKGTSESSPLLLPPSLPPLLLLLQRARTRDCARRCISAATASAAAATARAAAFAACAAAARSRSTCATPTNHDNCRSGMLDTGRTTSAGRLM